MKKAKKKQTSKTDYESQGVFGRITMFADKSNARLISYRFKLNIIIRF